MPNTKDIRKRIKAVKNTQKVTKAMKLISIIKSKQVQKIWNKSEPYYEQLVNLLQKTLCSLSLVSSKKNNLPALLLPNEAKAKCLLVISSDRGLCGAYNSNIFKELSVYLETNNKEHLKFILWGNKAISFMQSNFKDQEIIKAYPNMPLNPPQEVFKDLFQLIANLYQKQQIKSCQILYSHFISMIKSETKTISLLPFAQTLEQEKQNKQEEFSDFIFEPSSALILEQLITNYGQNQIYRTILSGACSELAHRVNAMTAATDNAAKLLLELNLTYNKLRQAAITQEISEIVAGAGL